MNKDNFKMTKLDRIIEEMLKTGTITDDYEFSEQKKKTIILRLKKLKIVAKSSQRIDPEWIKDEEIIEVMQNIIDNKKVNYQRDLNNQEEYNKRIDKYFERLYILESYVEENDTPSGNNREDEEIR